MASLVIQEQETVLDYTYFYLAYSTIHVTKVLQTYSTSVESSAVDFRSARQCFMRKFSWKPSLKTMILTCTAAEVSRVHS